MLTIAVVMTTFNGEEWLEAQLQSISSQSRLPDRLIISDDGSTDSTVDIARNFAKNAPFEVVLLEGPRAGVGENFWYATKHARTEVIAWCDQDDVWHPHKLQLCEQLMEARQVAFVSHSAVVTDAALVPTGRLYPHYRRTRVLEPLVGDPWRAVVGPFVPGFTILVRAELLQLARWEDRPSDRLWLNGRLAHDEVISLLAFATGQRLEVSDALASYRQHRENLAGAPKAHGLEQVRISLRSESTQYSYRAELADRYARFIAACTPLNTEAAAYFAKIGERCLRRSKIHQAPDRLSGARDLLVSVAKRDFCRRSRGGFGVLGLCRDVVALCLGSKGDR